MLQREVKVSDQVIKAFEKVDACPHQLIDGYREFRLCNDTNSFAELDNIGTTLFYEFVDKMIDYNQLCYRRLGRRESVSSG